VLRLFLSDIIELLYAQVSAPWGRYLLFAEDPRG
jgi:hypothetical protein